MGMKRYTIDDLEKFGNRGFKLVLGNGTVDVRLANGRVVKATLFRATRNGFRAVEGFVADPEPTAEEVEEASAQQPAA